MATTYSLDTVHQVPARSGVAVPVKQGQFIKVINTHGTQVIDFWAVHFPSTTGQEQSPPPTFLSMSHSRAASMHFSPVVGDTLVSNARRPLLKLTEDTSPGVHDTLIAACDRERYRQLGVTEETYHENCTDNFFNAVKPWGGVQQRVADYQTCPDPLNLFMNIPVDANKTGAGGHDGNRTAGGDIRFEPGVGQKGQFVIFEALKDVIVVMSACPQDLVNVNNMSPTEAHFVVSG